MTPLIHRPFLLLAVAFLLPSVASAQIRPSRLLPELSTAPGAVLKPGSWVRYTMYQRQTRKKVKVRMAALAREGKAQWFEIWFTDARRRTLIFSTLVEGSLAKPKRILKAVVQPPGQRALLLPDSLAAGQLPTFSEGPGPRATLVATEKVTVAAGTYRAKKYKRTHKGVTTHVWFSKGVKGWPMIKLVNPRVIMELAAFGTDARTGVKGKPVKMSKGLIKQLGL